MGKGITTDSSRKGNEFGIFEKYEHYLLWLEELEKKWSNVGVEVSVES